jgi:methyl-accepting chemotaxis protein
MFFSRMFFKLLAPFTFVISRLKYSQKFLLTSVLFAIPLILVLNLWLGQLQEDVRFTQKEEKGVIVIHSIMPLLLNFQQHRGLANGYLNGDALAKSTMEKKETEISKQLTAVGEIARSKGLARTETEVRNLKPEWEKLQTETYELTPKDSFSRHSQLIQQVQDLIITASDESNLTLDPQIDSFYLMDIMVNRIPELIEQTGQIRGKGNGILTRKQLSNDEKIEIHILQGMLEADNKGIEAAITHIQSYNIKLGTQLNHSGVQSLTSSKKYLSLVTDRIINDSEFTMKADAFFAEGTKTIADSAQLFEVVSGKLAGLLADRVDHLHSTRNVTLGVTLGTLVLVALFYIAFYLNVQKTVQLLKVISLEMAEGNFSRKVENQSRDELADIGHSFNRMSDSLTGLLRRNQQLSEQLAASSEELTAISVESSKAMEHIAAASQSISAGTDVQKRATREMSTAMNEMTIGVQRIAENSAEVADSAAIAMENAGIGVRQLQDAVGQMGTIQASVINSGDVIEQLGRHSERIENIVSVIMEISSQTQLLSLNANIEAARAGEHGRGFMVVASEVAKLAEQTKTSVKSISEVVTEMGGLVNQSLTSMTITARETDSGLQSIRVANGAIIDIMNTVKVVTEQIQEVSAAAEQMSASSQQVSASVNEVAGISQKTAGEAEAIASGAGQQLASLEEIQASAESLSNGALQLQDNLGQFILEERKAV